MAGIFGPARFIAEARGNQDTGTYRQFQRLQTTLQNLERRLEPFAARRNGVDMVLADTWAPVVPTTPPPEFPRAPYSAHITCFADGGNNNAECQFRVVDEDTGLPIVTGEIIDVGQRDRTITEFLLIPEDVGVISIEARGLSCTLTQIKILVTKIGISS